MAKSSGNPRWFAIREFPSASFQSERVWWNHENSHHYHTYLWSRLPGLFVRMTHELWHLIESDRHSPLDPHGEIWRQPSLICYSRIPLRIPEWRERPFARGRRRRRVGLKRPSPIEVTPWHSLSQHRHNLPCRLIPRQLMLCFSVERSISLNPWGRTLAYTVWAWPQLLCRLILVLGYPKPPAHRDTSIASSADVMF